MRETMAAILQIGADDISIKATTTEQMGFVGRGEGLVAYATVLLERPEGAPRTKADRRIWARLACEAKAQRSEE
jgi:hypothetical protein